VRNEAGSPSWKKKGKKRLIAHGVKEDRCSKKEPIRGVHDQKKGGTKVILKIEQEKKRSGPERLPVSKWVSPKKDCKKTGRRKGDRTLNPNRNAPGKKARGGKTRCQQEKRDPKYED